MVKGCPLYQSALWTHIVVDILRFFPFVATLYCLFACNPDAGNYFKEN